MIRIRSVAAYEVFQSTPPARGATDILVPGDDTETISIRAPAWGRPLGVDAVVEKGIFQFAPPHGGDGFLPLICTQRSYFNSRPRMGATGDKIRMTKHLDEFQFAPPHGGDGPRAGDGIGPCYFNSRPRMGATLPVRSVL